MQRVRLLIILLSGFWLGWATGCAGVFPADDATVASHLADLQVAPQPSESDPGATAAATKPVAVAKGKQETSPPGGPPDDASYAAAESPEQFVSQMQGLDRDSQRQLLADLQQVDPELWPQLLQSFRAAIATKQAVQAPGGRDDAPEMHSLDENPPRRPVTGASGLREHPYDPRVVGPTPESPVQMPNAPSTAPEQATSGLARLFDISNDRATALAGVDDGSFDDRDAVRNVSYEQSSNSVDARNVDAAIGRLETQLAAPTAELNDAARQQVALRLLYLASGRRDDSLRPIEGLPPAEQEYWSNQIYALATMLDAGRNETSDLRAAEAITHLDRARARLAEVGALQVKNLHFCTRVDGFGALTPFKEDAFKPGQDVVVYAELDNYCAAAVEGGYRTALVSRYRLLDSRGAPVVEHEFPAIEEVCGNRRRDYYLTFGLRVPKRAYDGRHTLELTVEDTIGKKVGQATVEFRVKE